MERNYGFYNRCRGTVSISECQNINSKLVDEDDMKYFTHYDNQNVQELDVDYTDLVNLIVDIGCVE